jgi:hypothetical protein
VPTSKFDRVVLSGSLVEAGLTLVVEAQSFEKSSLEQAVGIRNGLGLTQRVEEPSLNERWKDGRALL